MPGTRIYVVIYGLAMPAPRPVRGVNFASVDRVKSDRRSSKVSTIRRLLSLFCPENSRRILPRIYIYIYIYIYVVIYGLAMPAPRLVRGVNFASPQVDRVRSDRRRIKVSTIHRGCCRFSVLQIRVVSCPDSPISMQLEPVY